MSESLCYQILPFLMEHKVGANKSILVVSPLVALMEDQLYRLKRRGVRASSLSSATSVAKENIYISVPGIDNLFHCALKPLP